MQKQDVSRNGLKLIVLGVVVVLIGSVGFIFRESLSLEQLSQHEEKLTRFRDQNPYVVCSAGFLLYVAITGLSLPSAAPMSLAFGWFFGLWRAVLLLSFASTTGATVAFLLSRYLLRDAIQSKFGEQLSAFNKALEREGAFYLFSLRLIPAVPFFVINLVMGLTPMRVRTFWWVSQLGMLPGTIVIAYAGSQFPTLRDLASQGPSGILKPQLILALVALGLFPIVVKKTFERFRKRDHEPNESEQEDEQ